MSRRPRTETSTLVFGPVVTALLQVYRRTPKSTRGEGEGHSHASLPGTKEGFVTPDLRYANPWKCNGRLPPLSGGFCVTHACGPVCSRVDARPTDPRDAH